jgi:hypothetical protein
MNWMDFKFGSSTDLTVVEVQQNWVKPDNLSTSSRQAPRVIVLPYFSLLTP